ncbi:ABC transporter ATP-binding protein [Oribacterium sp. HCP28S3_H8]|uniref:ABC transporter ATP-binding protein n=1 Tax=Oribacterium sp. HCP28S3_H8 TaxID=3438945 RepID=UPI00304B8CE6|nr:ABC transporter ATP-binding protein [Oribacterium sp.]
MITMEHVVKQYEHVLALDNFSMTIPDGSLYGFVGPNGAGKTTAIRIMLGLIAPDAGTVRIDDMTAGANLRRLKRRVGYVPDYAGSYPDMRVSEYMEFFASCYDLSGARMKRRIQMLLDMVGLGGKEGQMVDALSQGMQQKLSIARALIHDPRILILDEPTSGLDPGTRYEVRQILSELCSEEEKTILISSHILTEISEICTDIGIINHGQMVMEGKLTEVLKKVNSSNPVIISVEGGIAPAMQILKQDPKVRSISIRNHELLISYDGNPEEEAGLLEDLVMEGIPVRGFHREKGNLEALFLQLTGAMEERRVASYEAESGL